MNREDIIRMARDAFIKRGFWPNEVMWECWKDAWLNGASAEREACAKLCEEGIANADDWNSAHWDQACENRAWAIRARGQT